MKAVSGSASAVSFPQYFVHPDRGAGNAVSIPRGLMNAGTGHASKTNVPRRLVEVLHAQLVFHIGW